MTPLASLAIPTRNRSRFLARTLASFVGQREPRFEVVIVDDGGDDDTRDLARGFAGELDLRYIRRAHTGIAASRNAAIRASRGEVIIFTDDDRVADPGFVADHVAAHAGVERRVAAGRQRGLFAEWARDAAYTAADLAALVVRHPALAPRLLEPRAELVAPEAIRADLAGVLAAFGLDEPWFETTARPVIERHGAQLVGFPFPWTLGIGGNVSVRRALLDEVGLLDERFVGWGLEDAELHYRLHLAGARTVILDGGLNYHQVHRRGPERAAEWARNAVRLLDKHGTLEVCLYLAVCRRQLALDEAAAILAEHARLGGGAPALVGELVRTAREHLRLLAGAAAG